MGADRGSDVGLSRGSNMGPGRGPCKNPDIMEPGSDQVVVISCKKHRYENRESMRLELSWEDLAGPRLPMAEIQLPLLNQISTRKAFLELVL